MNEHDPLSEANSAKQPPRLTAKPGARPPVSATSRKEGISPLFVLHAARRWWKVAAPLGILLAALSGSVVFLLFEPMYLAVGQIRIFDLPPHLAFPSTSDKQQTTRFVQTQMQLLRLPVVLRAVKDDPAVKQHPEMLTAPDPIAYLAREIKAKPIGDSEIYSIEYQAPDALRAKQVVDAVIKSYMNYVESFDAEYRSAMLRSLEREIEKNKAATKILRETVKKISEETGIAPSQPGPAVSGVEDPATQLQTLLVEAEVDIIMLSAAIEFAEKHTDQPIELSEDEVEAAVGAQLMEKRHEIELKKQQIKQLEATAARNSSPFLQQQKMSLEAAEEAYAKLEADLRAQARIEIGKGIEQDRDAGLEELRWKLATAQAKKETLTKRLKENEVKTTASIGDQMLVDFANRELLQAEAVYAALTQQKSKLTTEEGAPKRVSALFDKEGVPKPLEPITSIPLKEMALAVALSLCLPFGLAIGWEWTVKRVNNIDEIRQQMGVEILGEISALPSFAYGNRSSKRSIANRQVFEESVDGLRTRLVLADSMCHVQILAIASAVSSEGKTSVAINLAMSLARTTGKRNLLIDGDLRAPDVHRMFDAALAPGLCEVLQDEANVREAIVASGVPGLDVLPAGVLSTNPHRLLNNEGFGAMLDQLRDDYAYIIIDTPPVLGASESLVMAKHADATVVCAMRDRSRMSHMQQAYTRLVNAGARTVGVVMSGLPVRSYASRYGSYSYGKTPHDV